MSQVMQEQNLTRGPLANQILLFGIPLVLSNLLQLLFNLADVAVVGQFAGTLALGSVGSSSLLASMFVGFFLGLGGGINVQTARCYGAHDVQALRRTIHSAAIISVLLGLAVMAAGLPLTRPVLELLDTRPELLDGAVIYIRLYLLGVPALAVFNFGNAVFSAIGDTKKPLQYLILSGIVNIILNLFFCAGVSDGCGRRGAGHGHLPVAFCCTGNGGTVPRKR